MSVFMEETALLLYKLILLYDYMCLERCILSFHRFKHCQSCCHQIAIVGSALIVVEGNYTMRAHHLCLITLGTQ